MYPKYGVGLLKIVLLLLALAETFTDSVIDCVIYSFTYAVDYSEYSPSSSSLYYFSAYLQPTKHFYKVIIVLYVPVFCLWKVRNRRATISNSDVINGFDLSECQLKNAAPSRLKRYNFQPAAKIVCRRIIHGVLYFRHVPRGAVNLAFLPQTVLQRFKKIIGLALSSTPVPQMRRNLIQHQYFNRQNPSSSPSLDCVNNADEEIDFSMQVQQSFDDEMSAAGRYGGGGQKVNTSWGLLVSETEERHQAVLKQNLKKFNLCRNLPLNWASRLYGKIHGVVLPMWLRVPVISGFIWLFGCNLDEAAVRDLTRYRNIGEFFRRSLRKGVRRIARSSELTSPSDGAIVFCGPVVDDCLEQVKGVTYSLYGFFGPRDRFLTNVLTDVTRGELSAPPPFGQLIPGDVWSVEAASELTSGYSDELLRSDDLITRRGNVLYQCVVYLAPGDYHHFHSPADWTVTARRHFPGELFSVSPSVSCWLQGLFNYNERVVYMGEWQHGFFSMTAVGATLVGSINVFFDKVSRITIRITSDCQSELLLPGTTLSTNDELHSSGSYFHDRTFVSQEHRSKQSKHGAANIGPSGGVQLSKGQQMGEFRLGSTVVLIFEAPPNFRFSVRNGQRIKYGNGITNWRRRPKNDS